MMRAISNISFALFVAMMLVVAFVAGLFLPNAAGGLDPASARQPVTQLKARPNK